MVTKRKPITLSFTQADLTKCRGVLAQATGTVDEVTVANVFQYLKPADRVKFANELYRVMKKGAKCQVTLPHWAANNYYSDLAVQWPPVVEGWFFHLNKAWREANKPVANGYKCSFATTWGYGMHPALHSRNQEYQQNALQYWKEAAQAIVATLIKE